MTHPLARKEGMREAPLRFSVSMFLCKECSMRYFEGRGGGVILGLFEHNLPLPVQDRYGIIGGEGGYDVCTISSE